jgi:FlaA1/EpsC-like NDP-sugar epimerase
LSQFLSLGAEEAFAAGILDRKPRPFSTRALRGVVAGRVVLITGAGGFIGSGLVRLVAALEPSRIVLVDNGEYGLYGIDADLRERHPHLSHRAVYCDVRDAVAVSRCFLEEQPEIVFHAAALKQLPLMEAHPREAALTNVIGARHVAEAAYAAGAKAMVLISTDKAVHATSVLGATKRLAEAFCQAMDVELRATRFVSVRFGNVFGSTGSVVPLFRRQIEAGGPVTITDERMTRYFLTPAEASGLVLSASALALEEEDERGHVFMLETGEPIRIGDIARRMIALSGRDVPIVAIGSRPGERLSERLVHEAEEALATSVAGVRRLRPRTCALPIMRHQIAALERACAAGDDIEAARVIGRCVPEFITPAELPRTLGKASNCSPMPAGMVSP